MSARPSLHHLFMLVSDLDRSKRFYCELLGLEVLVDEGRYVRIGGGEGFHIGMEAGDPNRLGGRGIEISIQVDDVDAVYEVLISGGVEFTAQPEDMPWGARHAFLRDPDGYELSLFTPQ